MNSTIIPTLIVGIILGKLFVKASHSSNRANIYYSLQGHCSVKFNYRQTERYIRVRNPQSFMHMMLESESDYEFIILTQKINLPRIATWMNVKYVSSAIRVLLNILGTFCNWKELQLQSHIVCCDAGECADSTICTVRLHSQPYINRTEESIDSLG